MPSSVLPAAYLAAAHAFLSGIIKESGNTAAPTPSATPNISESSNTPPGRLPTPPSTPEDKKGKDKAPIAAEKDNQSLSTPDPDAASPPPAHVRKLVTVRRISAVDKSNRDYIKLTIDGWTVGVKHPSKAKFEAGHRAVFLEPDTLLPADHPRFKDLFAQVGNPITYNGRNWFRVGTRSTGNPRFSRWHFTSQGHVFPLQDFPEIHDDVMLKTRLAKFGGEQEDGTKEQELVDYSAMLGAIKWDPHGDSSSAPKNKSNSGNGNNTGGKSGNTPAPSLKKPSWIQKTDSERVQNCLNLFIKPQYKYVVYQESVKIDGASMTCYFVPKQSKYFKQLHNPHPGPDSAAQSVFETGRFGVCSKHVDLPFSVDCPYWAAAIANNIGALLEDLHLKGRKPHSGALAIQGELVGPTISGNHYGLPSTSAPSFTVFSVWDIENQNRWYPPGVQKFCATYGLSHVEVLGYHKLTDIASSHDELIARANARQGEGLVFKSCAADGRWFKVLSDRWITERGDEVDAKLEAAQLTDVEATPTHSAVIQESEKVVDPEVKNCQTKGEEKKVTWEDIHVMPEDELRAPSENKAASISNGNNNDLNRKNDNTAQTHATNSGQVQEVQVEAESFGQQQADDNDSGDKDRPEYTEAELRETKIQEEKKIWIENWLDNTAPADEEMKAKEALVADSMKPEDAGEGTAEEALVADNMKPEDAGEGTAEEALVADKPEDAGEGTAEEALVTDKHKDAGEETSERVSIQDIEENPAEKKAGELSDTPSPKEFDNVQDYLDAAVTWLGQPMSHREAIGEIGRIILTEMAINKENIQASMKDLAEVVLDELKFTTTSTDVADQEAAAKQETSTRTNIAPTVPDAPNSPTSPNTPTTLNAPNTPHESNPAMEPEIVSDAVTGPAEQNAIGNPTPPASEHNDEQNEFAGVNWDDYKIFKRGGQMVCIRREDYVPRSPPSLYPSAEEMARRRQQRRRRYRH